MRTIQRSAAFAVFDMAAGRCGFGKNSIANFAIFRCHGLNRKLLDDDVALIERKVNACIFPVKTGLGSPSPPRGASSAIPTRWSFRVPRAERKLQPIDEFAADSLQIAQKENFDAIIDCVIGAKARGRPEDWLWSVRDGREIGSGRAADAGLGEGRHAVVTGRRRLQDRKGKRRS